MQTVTPTHSYRAVYIPPGLEADDVEAHAARGALKQIRLRAQDATQAAACAIWATGRPVLEVQRVEVPAC